MRNLKIETYALDSKKLIDSTVVPLLLVKTFAKLLPKNIASKFDENGEQLEQLVSAIASAKEPSVLLDINDTIENERIVFSVT
ncbi:conserved hypothetical protein [Vibrio chagasii]|nr:conserved hypothetical protein [Vibrio chagasii]